MSLCHSRGLMEAKLFNYLPLSFDSRLLHHLSLTQWLHYYITLCFSWVHVNTFAISIDFFSLSFFSCAFFSCLFICLSSISFPSSFPLFLSLLPSSGKTANQLHFCLQCSFSPHLLSILSTSVTHHAKANV